MTQARLNVTGMSCTGCEQRISAALKRLDGVDHVSADHRAGTVVVEYDPGAVEQATIIGRLEAAGYDTSPRHQAAREREQ